VVGKVGTLAPSGSVQYTYDAMQQRTQKTGGSNPGEFVYFAGHPVAVLNPQTGVWTDLIYAGDNLIAEAGPNQQSFSYRLLDHLGSPAFTTDASGNVTGAADYAPYGPLLSSSVSDPYVYTGLFQDTEYGSYHAWHRNESAEQIRWLSPDPYNGSYDVMNPQSLNRYAYVDNNPMASTDPSGLNFASELCSMIPSNILQIISTNGNSFKGGGLTGALNDAKWGAGYASQIQKGSCTSTLEAVGKFAVESIISNALASASGYKPPASGSPASYGPNTPAAYMAYIQAAITIACSIDYNKTACGAPQLAWLIPGDAGLAVGDAFAVGAAVCATLGPASGGIACAAVALYQLANSVYDFFYNLFGWGPPKFTGSLLPRPTDLGGLGTAPIGIPNQNLKVDQLLGLPGQSPVPSPVPMVR
jgi:RHS repeat-associated protein